MSDRDPIFTTAADPGGSAAPEQSAGRKQKSRRKTTYERTPEEQAVIDRLKARVAEKPPVPKWSVIERTPGVYDVKCDHPDPATGLALTMALLGIASSDTLAAVLNSLVETTKIAGVPNNAAFQRLFSMLVSLAPQDEKELLLCLEMVCVHDASMAMSALVRSARSNEERALATDGLNKLARTHAQLLETLKRYRSPGQQVIVKRVTVNEGGQAIVGAVGRDGSPPLVHVSGDAVATTAPATDESAAREPRAARPRAPGRAPMPQIAPAEPPLTLDLEPRREPAFAPPRAEPKINRLPPEGWQRFRSRRRGP